MRKKKKFPVEPPAEDEIVTLRREHRQFKATLRERDQQIVFLAGVLRRETEAVNGFKEILQTFCRTVLAVRDRATDEIISEGWSALLALAEEWLGEGGSDDHEAASDAVRAGEAAARG